MSSFGGEFGASHLNQWGLCNTALPKLLCAGLVFLCRAPCICANIILIVSYVFVDCSCLGVDTLRRHELAKFNKAVAYYEDKAGTLPTVLYFNKGL